jgi:hypothetical protein
VGCSRCQLTTISSYNDWHGQPGFFHRGGAIGTAPAVGATFGVRLLLAAIFSD